jgi:hypothetical protein
MRWCLFHIISLYALYALAAGAAPRLECDERVYDFGTLIGSNEIAHEYVVWNRGDETAYIAGVKACCGVAAQVSAMEIPPGSNVICRAVFSAGRREGRQEKQIFLATNNRQQPYFELLMRGELMRAFRIEPSIVRAELVRGRPWSQDIRAMYRGSAGDSLLRVDSTISGIRAEVVETDDQLWVIRLRSDGTLPAGPLSGWITLHFSSGVERVRVDGKVVEMVRVTPEKVQFPAAFTKPVKRYLMLRGSDGATFSLLSAELCGMEGSVQMDRMAADRWKIAITADPGSMGDHPVLKLKTDLDDMPELLIPIVRQ